MLSDLHICLGCLFAAIPAELHEGIWDEKQREQTDAEYRKQRVATLVLNVLIVHDGKSPTTVKFLQRWTVIVQNGSSQPKPVISENETVSDRIKTGLLLRH
jgi:hypothetical protein